MKKLILGLMLVMASLSFSKDCSSSHQRRLDDRRVDNHDFTVRVGVNKNINQNSQGEYLFFENDREDRD